MGNKESLNVNTNNQLFAFESTNSMGSNFLESMAKSEMQKKLQSIRENLLSLEK